MAILRLFTLACFSDCGRFHVPVSDNVVQFHSDWRHISFGKVRVEAVKRGADNLLALVDSSLSFSRRGAARPSRDDDGHCHHHLVEELAGAVADFTEVAEGFSRVG